jgi:hypothetical protein
VWITVLAVVVVVGLLALFDVIPLGLGDGVERGGGAGGEGALEGGEEEGTGAASLVGRGKRATEDPAKAGADLAPPPIAEEIRGTRSGGGILRGRVVRAAGGVPVEGAQVLLRHPDPILTYLRASPKGRFDLLEARTGKDGRFAFLDIVPARGYAVRVKAGAAASVSVEKIDLRGRESRDLGDLVVGPEGKVEGRVVDGEDKPVAGAKAAISWRVTNPLGIVLADPATLPETEASTTTAADGTFSLSALEPGDKTLVVKSDRAGSEVDQDLSVVAGKTTETTVRLAGDEALAGRVEWADGKPLAGARVFAGQDMTPAVRTVDTGPDGTFRLAPLAQGTYRLGVLVPGLPVNLSDGHQTGRDDLVVVFPVPGSLRGQVVRKSDGQPVPRFGIVLEPVNSERGMELFIRRLVDTTLGPQGFEDPKGVFELPRAPAGSYVVVVTADGFPSTRSAPVAVASGTAAEVKIELPDGNRAAGIVRLASGDPLAEALVFVLPADASEDESLGDVVEEVESREPDTTTGPDGTFTTSPQAPGSYDVVAVHAKAVPMRLRGVDLKARSVEGLVITLKAAGTVAVTLVDERGQPAPHESLDLVFADGTVFEGRTDLKGEYRRDSVPVGGCVVRWRGLYGYSKVRAVVAAQGEDAKRAAYDVLKADHGEQFVVGAETNAVTVRLPRRVRFHGVIRVPSGVDWQAQGLWFQSPEPEGIGMWVSCNDRGEFDHPVEPGTYVVWRRISEDDWGNQTVVIPDAAEHRMEFR